MNINTLFCCFVVLTIATIPSTNEELTRLSACTKGRITYYTSYVNGGACGYGSVSSKVTEGYIFNAALNEAFFDSSNKCGICYEITGPDGAIRVMATDLCPVSGNEAVCSGDMLHFDLAENAVPYIFDPVLGNGNVTFRMVACDLDGNIKLKTGSKNNDYYFGFVVTNHVIGVKSAAYSFDDGETYTTIDRGGSNLFAVDPSQAIPLPFKIKLTSIVDEELVFDVNSIEGGIYVDSGVQFEVPSDLYFDVETLETTTTKPDDIDECCDQPDDVATIYDDNIRGIWLDNGWGTYENTVDCTDNPHIGSYCLKTELAKGSGLQFWGDYDVKPELYSNLTFYVKSDTAADNCLFIFTPSNTNGKYISISEANIWQYVNIPMEELTTGDSFQEIDIQNRVTDRAYYFDEVKWIPTDVDSSICADKYVYNGLNKGIGITIASILMIFIILI